MVEKIDKIKAGLDGDKTHLSVLAGDVANLKDAEKYNIDLAGLESFSQIKKDINKDEDWQNLDVRLKDVINFFIATSDSPVFMVRDDRVVYINQAALDSFNIAIDKEFVGSNFFNLVLKDDWALLSESIAEMLTDFKEVKIRIKNAKGKIFPAIFRAIYLPESDHFSFILIGERQIKKEKTEKIGYNALYDEKTGLPNFFLFEDRVQVAIREGVFDRKTEQESLVAIIALNIDNLEQFKSLHIDNFILNKTAEVLVLSLQKNATVAAGIKYSFWLMLKAKNQKDLNDQIVNIVKILNMGIRDNFVEHKLLFSMGISVFPHNSTNSKRLMEQAIKALEKNQKNKESVYTFFTE